MSNNRNNAIQSIVNDAVSAVTNSMKSVARFLLEETNQKNTFLDEFLKAEHAASQQKFSHKKAQEMHAQVKRVLDEILIADEKALKFAKLSKEAKKDGSNYSRFTAAYDNQCNALFIAAHKLSKLVQSNDSWTLRFSADRKEIQRNSTQLAKWVGDYAAFEITRQPARLQSQPEHIRKLIQLTYLRQSPASFLNAISNTAITYHIDQIARNIAALKKTASGITASAADRVERCAEIRRMDLLGKLNGNIIALEKSWTRKLFGWATGANKKLAELKQLHAIVTPMAESVVNAIIQHNGKAFNEYEKIKPFIEAEKTLDENQENLLNAPYNVAASNIPAIRRAVITLIQSTEKKTEDKKKKSLTFVVNLKEKVIEKVKGTANDLQNQLAIFDHAEVAQIKELNQAREDIVKAIEARVDEFTDSRSAINYIEQLQTANLAALDVNLAKRVAERLEQHYNVMDLKNTFEQMKDPAVNIDVVDNFFKVSLALLAKKTTPEMKQLVKEFVENIKNGLIDYLNNPASNAANINQLKSHLSLFSAEKFTNLDNDVAKYLIDARNSINQTVVNYIEKQESIAELETKLEDLQKIWPEALLPDYIAIENTGIDNLYIEDSARLEQMADVNLTPDARNYIVSIGGVTLKPYETRMFWCVPAVKNEAIQTAINHKFKKLVKNADSVARIEHSFSEKLNFLKTGETGALRKLWNLITNNTDTPLTLENQRRYGEDLVDDYVEALNAAVARGTNYDRKIVAKQIVQDVEDVAKGLNTSLNALLFATERSKFEKAFKQESSNIDIGRMLLQWQFINRFRKEYGAKNIPSAEQINVLYRNAGVGMIYKMDEIAKENPRFITDVLGHMTKEQLDTLNSTFVTSPTYPSSEDYKDIYKIDLIGDQQIVGSAGQTILRKSMLLSQVSALVIQELNDFLNYHENNHQATRIDMDLFKQHINFVREHLADRKTQESVLNDSMIASHLKQDIEEAVRSIQSMIMPQIIACLGNVDDLTLALQAVRDIARKSTKEPLFNESIVRKIVAIINKTSTGDTLSHCDVLTITTQLDSIATAISDRKLDSIPEIKALREALKALPAALELKGKYDALHMKDESLSLTEFIKQIPQEVVDELANHNRDDLAQLIMQIRYAFADRFTKTIQTMLSKEQLETIPNASSKLRKLAGCEFAQLVDLVFQDKEIANNLFCITQTSAPLIIEKSHNCIPSNENTGEMLGTAPKNTLWETIGSRIHAPKNFGLFQPVSNNITTENKEESLFSASELNCLRGKGTNPAVLKVAQDRKWVPEDEQTIFTFEEDDEDTINSSASSFQSRK